MAKQYESFQNNMALRGTEIATKILQLVTGTDSLKLELAAACNRRLAYYENSDAPSSTDSLYNAEHAAYRKGIEDEDKTKRDTDNENVDSNVDLDDTDNKSSNVSAGTSHSNKGEETITSRITQCS